MLHMLLTDAKSAFSVSDCEPVSGGASRSSSAMSQTCKMCNGKAAKDAHCGFECAERKNGVLPDCIGRAAQTSSLPASAAIAHAVCVSCLVRSACESMWAYDVPCAHHSFPVVGMGRFDAFGKPCKQGSFHDKVGWILACTTHVCTPNVGDLTTSLCLQRACPTCDGAKVSNLQTMCSAW